MTERRIDILGEEWKVLEATPKEFPKLAMSVDGYADASIKTIVIDDMTMLSEKGDPEMAQADLGQYKKKLIRHELVHAFLEESGLACETTSEWALNEEMVDWIAIQLPKICRACMALGVM